MKEWKNWSPWIEMDTAMYTKIEGEDGKVGARYNWKSNNPDVGNGNMIFIDFETNRINFNINHHSPFIKTHNASFYIKENSKGNSVVTWRLNGKSSFFERIASVFWGMDAMVGPDLEKGLRNLKNLAEKEKIKAIPIERVEEFIFNKTIFLTRKIRIVPLQEASSLEYFKKEVKGILAYANKNKIEITGPPTTLIYKWDTIKKKITMAIVLPIDSVISIDSAHSIIKIKESQASKFSKTGIYSTLPEVHDKLRMHLMIKGLEQLMPMLIINNLNLEQEANPENWKPALYTCISNLTYLVDKSL